MGVSERAQMLHHFAQDTHLQEAGTVNKFILWFHNTKSIVIAENKVFNLDHSPDFQKPGKASNCVTR